MHVYDSTTMSQKQDNPGCIACLKKSDKIERGLSKRKLGCRQYQYIFIISTSMPVLQYNNRPREGDVRHTYTTARPLRNHNYSKSTNEASSRTHTHQGQHIVSFRPRPYPHERLQNDFQILWKRTILIQERPPTPPFSPHDIYT